MPRALLLASLTALALALLPARAGTVPRHPAAQKAALNDALIRAVGAGDVNKVKACLAHGADVNAASGGGTALETAAQQGNLALVRLLIKDGAKTDAPHLGDALLSAAVGGVPEVVIFFLDRGAGVNFRGKRGLTPLTAAAAPVAPDGLEIVRLLVKRGADVNAPGEDGLTALQVAVAGPDPNPDVVRFLLDKGANPNVKDKPLGRTVLDEAKEVAQSARQENDTLAKADCALVICLLKRAGAK